MQRHGNGARYIPNHAPNGNYKAYLLLHEIANVDRILMCKEKELLIYKKLKCCVVISNYYE
jgi:hypothetical protein